MYSGFSVSDTGNQLNQLFSRFLCRTQTPYSVFLSITTIVGHKQQNRCFRGFLCRTQTTSSFSHLRISCVRHRHLTRPVLVAIFCVGHRLYLVIFEIVCVGHSQLFPCFSRVSVSDTYTLLSYFRDCLCRIQTIHSVNSEIVRVGHRKRTRSIVVFHVSDTDNLFSVRFALFCVGHEQLTRSVIFAVFCVGRRQLPRLLSRLSRTQPICSVLSQFSVSHRHTLFSFFRNSLCRTRTTNSFSLNHFLCETQTP